MTVSIAWLLEMQGSPAKAAIRSVRPKLRMLLQGLHGTSLGTEAGDQRPVDGDDSARLGHPDALLHGREKDGAIVKRQH